MHRREGGVTLDDLRARIENFVSRAEYSPMRRRELARAMRVDGDDYPIFREALDRMEREGELVLGRGRRYSATARSSRLVRGRIEIKGGRYGFLKPREPGEEDLFVPPGSLGGAMDGDEVLVERMPGGRRGPTARVVKVVERMRVSMTGVFFSTGRGGVVIPDSRGLGDIKIPAGETSGAEDNQKVLVSISGYPGYETLAVGSVERVLGAAGTWEAERAARIAEYGIRFEFDDDVEAEAAAFDDGLTPQDRARRADYTGEVCFTIDPADARDHDDAVSVEAERGGWRLRVHIADVAQYVRAGSALDREARLRSTSTYVPGEVFRMLPDRLSADLCSLVEGRDRPAKTVTMRFDREGRRKSFVIERSVVRSAKSLTYEGVRAALEGDPAEAEALDGGILDMLREARELHEVLRRKRMLEGSLDFSFPEVRVAMHEDGRVASLTRHEADFTHHMVEEFMLAANRAVAEFLIERGAPGIHRIHEEPSEDALRDFAAMCREYGIVLRPPYSRPRLAKALERAEEIGVGETLAFGLLRAMKLARYHEKSIPHYALGFERYLHFTSPIRRYPDLWVHRTLDAFFEPGGPRAGGEYRRGELGRVMGIDPGELLATAAHVAEHCSVRERASEAAERELTRFRQLEFLRERSEGVHKATVRNVRDDGLTVELDCFWVWARVPIDRLGRERYRHDPSSRCLAGRKGRRIRIGDVIDVRVDDVDLVAMEVICSAAT